MGVTYTWVLYGDQTFSDKFFRSSAMQNEIFKCV